MKIVSYPCWVQIKTEEELQEVANKFPLQKIMEKPGLTRKVIENAGKYVYIKNIFIHSYGVVAEGMPYHFVTEPKMDIPREFSENVTSDLLFLREEWIKPTFLTPIEHKIDLEVREV